MVNRREAISIGAGAALAAGIVYATVDWRKPLPKSIVIAGDSLGVGMALAAGLPYVARVGTRATDTVAINKQMNLAPPDHLIVMSLGTNDAFEEVSPVLVRAAALSFAQRGLPLVLVGPPVMKASWDARAAAVDAALAQQAWPSTTRYVSLRGFDTAPWTRSKDGIHFTAKGYGALWKYVLQHLG